MIKRQIPNLITLGNLLCGVIACYFAARGNVQVAALFICLGIFLDFFDGLAARLLNVASPLGKELDSLADVVTSGVAPGIILLHLLRDNASQWLALVALLVPLFAAYRLAKFNLDTRQSHSFLGLRDAHVLVEGQFQGHELEEQRCAVPLPHWLRRLHRCCPPMVRHIAHHPVVHRPLRHYSKETC